MHDIHTVALKSGLGFRPESTPDISTDEWVYTQLNSELSFKALKTCTSELPVLTNWPSQFNFSLAERIQRMQAQERARLEIDMMSLSDAERALAHGRNWQKYQLRNYDQLKFFHSGTFDEAQIPFRLALFWFNHFTVGSSRNSLEYAGDYWQNTIAKNLRGTFKELLLDAITHPAMLSYLDNVSNIGENSIKSKGCRDADCVIGFNDNLARELLELHTLGSSFGYTEKDIREAAKTLAGWGRIFHLEDDEEYQIRDFRRPWYEPHAEFGEKLVLGQNIPEGPEGLIVLIDFLARHPATVQRLSEKLARHFIGPNASEDDVNAITKAWMETDGNLVAVHSAMLERLLVTDATSFDWPIIWAFRMLRVSGSKLVKGIDDLGDDFMDNIERDPGRLMEELGNSFWVSRQPNGYSDKRSDWLSTEHLDRRIRFASLVAKGGSPTVPPIDIAKRYDFENPQLELLKQARDTTELFVLLACNQKFLEV